MAKLSDLRPDEANANRHTERGTFLVNNSLRQYGAGRSILIDKNNRIIAGNLTAEQAADIGLEDVIIVDTAGDKLVAVRRTDLDLNDPAARSLAILDNRTAQLSIDFDVEQLLRDATAGVDLDAVGFRDDEIKELLATLERDEAAAAVDPGPQVDRAEELQQKWQVRPGDLWQLDSHRLICGDCTDRAVVERVMQGERAAAVVTDPPYSSGGFTRGDRTLGTDKKYIQSRTKLNRQNFSGDNRDQRSWISWSERWLSLYLSICEVGAVIAAWSDWRQLPALTDAIQGGGWVWRGIAVWDKTEAARPLYGRFKPQAEYLVWGSAGNLPLNDGRPSYPGVFRQSVDSDKLHQTQKPVPAVEWSLSMTLDSSIVCDPFLGSGTTLIACQNLGRQCRAVEISPAYCAVALERWSAASGRQPVKVSP